MSGHSPPLALAAGEPVYFPAGECGLRAAVSPSRERRQEVLTCCTPVDTREPHLLECPIWSGFLHSPWNEIASFVFAVINYSPDEIMDLTLRLQSEGKDSQLQTQLASMCPWVKLS